ncbi:MAG: proton-conducting transporter membrane subunit, partial [Acidobacteriota bacterium]
KKALAASTSAQYGLMFVAVGAGATAAMTVHLVAHAAFKALLFLGAGMALHTAGTLDLGRLRLGSVLPVTARLVAIGALALAAVPPLGGAYSKEQILAAAAGASFARPWLAAGVTAAGFLSALYAGRLYLLAFGPGGPPPATQTEPPAERWSLALLAGLSVALGLLWIPAAARSVTGILPGALPEESPALLAVSIGSIGLAAVLCWRWWSSGRLLTIGLPDSLRMPAAEWLGLPAMARRIVIDPARRFSGLLAVFDNKGVDAGIRTTAAIATLISNLMSGWTERRFDFAVAGVARWTTGLAGASGRTDDHGIDAAVEGVARDIGWAGQQSRRLQTGLAHHYYVILVAGALVALAVAAFGR